MSAPSKTEIRWTLYQTEQGEPRFLVTSDAKKSWFFLYDLSCQEPVRLGKERTPILLENKYKVIEKLTESKQKGRSR